MQAATIAGGKTGDNVTALAVTWHGEDLPFENRNLHSLPTGSVVTSIQAARHADLDGRGTGQAIDTSEIDRAVAEMRVALTKTESD